ncbi:hypothetical protein AVEN_274407-1 [Araneus ventricosus]|uniref:Uncharacterized protein n=1 Tax=Araneus ventricosus TaxID=182803 RepID=A0A4Y2E4D8_ARAVE|nr:hypothetical protein AVEN_274407-1 [Araneus ventricosus]
MSDSMIHRSEEKSALEDDWLEFQLKRIITPRPRSFIGRVELPSNREISNDIKEWAIRGYLMDTEIAQLMEAPDCEVKDVPEHENHTSEKSATFDYDENIVTQTIDNVQHIQSKYQNLNWSLDQVPGFG